MKKNYNDIRVIANEMERMCDTYCNPYDKCVGCPLRSATGTCLASDINQLLYLGLDKKVIEWSKNNPEKN